jgi:hypothetical protein
MPEAPTPVESFNPTEFGVRLDTKKKHEALPFWRASSRRAGFEGLPEMIWCANEPAAWRSVESFTASIHSSGSPS